MKSLYQLFFLLFILPSFAQSLVINEIITSNSSVIADDDGSYEDWVELYNGTSESINLEGYGLTDNANPFKWVFPAKNILPGEYLLIWCSEKDRRDPNAVLHTNFKISSGGEAITLSSSLGIPVDAYPAIVIPQNYTYGRAADGVAFLIFSQPTPRAANTTAGYNEILAPPSFSAASGFYTNSFNLNLSSNVDGATILYTLDGSEPSEDNLNGTTYQYKNQYPENPGDAIGSFLQQSFKTNAYSMPLGIENRDNEPNKLAEISTTIHAFPYYIPRVAVPKSTVVRARAVKAGSMSSAVVTKNYFVAPNSLNRFSLPIIAINTNEDNLFDYYDGINVAGEDFDNWRESYPDAAGLSGAANYQRSGDDTEIKANFSYFNAGNEVLNQDVGMRINGGYSRHAPNKSFRIYARSEFGDGDLSFPFYGPGNDGNYKTLILRNSGNDAGFTYFLDAFVQKSVNHLHFDTQDYQPAVTFVNGEYWGLLNIRERYDKHYFERVYGIAEQDLDYLGYEMQLTVKEGSAAHYESLINYIENNSLSNNDNYNYVKTQLDPENFADYFITEIFVANTDWPGNNIEFFRKKTDSYEPDAAYGNDGRWRWLLKDTDHGLGLVSGYSHNTLSFATSTDAATTAANPLWATVLFRKLLENSEFKRYFISRFADLLNTTFLPSRLNAIHGTLKDAIASEIPNHIDRWTAMWTLSGWENNCNTVLQFAQERPNYQRQHIREKFEISNNVEVTVNVSGGNNGYIAVNTININSETPGVGEHPYPWTGVYFSGVPVTLKGIALPGYQFSHWSGDSNSTEAEITITPSANISLTAHFEATDVVAVEEPVYFWIFNSAIANDTPLTNINATYTTSEVASLTYTSCLSGYPFSNTHANWRKASMERRNSPTVINYIPQANNDILFADADMKAIQIKQPFQHDGLENTMIFTMPTTGYNNLKFAFAAKDENAADGIIIEYSSTSGVPDWSTSAISNSVLPLTSNYQLYNVDFANVIAANDNPDFKIRLRFTGNNMTSDEGNRVTFNNISLSGTHITAGFSNIENVLVTVYPNPADDILQVRGVEKGTLYSIFSYDGKVVSQGSLQNNSIDISKFAGGIYTLQLVSGNMHIVKKIIKK